MRVSFFYILILFALASCAEKDKLPLSKKQPSTSIEYPFMSRFGLQDNDNLWSDSNTVLFFKTQPFDTTFLLKLQKKPNFVKVVYYRSTPMDWAMTRQYVDTSNELAHFDGFSFKASTNIWDTLMQELKSMHFDSTVKQNFPGCCDMPFYFVLFNGNKFTNSNSANERLLYQFTLFLKERLLNKYDKYMISK